MHKMVLVAKGWLGSMKENSSLKHSLIYQSFAPLFALILIKHFPFSFISIPCELCVDIQQQEVLDKICNFPQLGDFIISVISLVYLVYASLIYKGFEGMHCTNFRSAGERVIIEEDNRDSGASFLVSFVLPLLMGDFKTLRGMIVFFVLLWFVIKLLNKSNLFYQNPILPLLGYECFSFKFVNPSKDVENPDKVYIGITKGTKISMESCVKRKYIADDVFLIYNE